MLGLFFYYQEPGFLQHDMVEFAMYAEYTVLNQYDALYEPYFSTVIFHGFPWRTGTNYLTTGIFYITNLLGISSEQTTMWTQFLFGSFAKDVLETEVIIIKEHKMDIFFIILIILFDYIVFLCNSHLTPC